ncbi:MAG: hypothetical protein A3G52_03900 [Candidatus Taylorbacteria bacterium RIFCSPLOWO2_12_FULL_43_20]|uniref:Prepilin-type N-terminal cleavage/methylation domain-containing protein n=1 Tax=Candidatus Taylorbacteria bacterium RIFCSPLOWO2_12_FULL_43_20 TaxID=1802332 RepID=A0A1G2P417_9BACT|nr:MAG: hypothetical protein A2825_02225 [Candidatus Taylorbacteria bacterium RIFCSPHIGHO2_01_FULL_43_120]OHA22838.1 MAG: hypothetical protein A3B98_01430 [Candidatus Taylorbacteria bacterium RIFCSPHIGHO2_02_FULL_43_55]OHA29381.1 MAG: hypothetical protein A3E92_02475 [Candidatus Taylorbacteria bacterium RIFCSPHIGHO2_12_FULL_42_34]OHA31757.1 MAG: hypothetical protein A3B09_01915 [Candidatus Taylorbacteria bacterium RIFCSPLOWO2_01_FULL_43_83]OHA38572.1 MAG: hypothetical protein A3H58_00200 [Candi
MSFRKKFKKRIHEYHAGFSIIEMIVSVTIFIVVMTVAAGAVLTIADANRKSQSAKIAIDNLGFALESMSRHIRVGTSYSCTENPDEIDTVCKYNNGSGTKSDTFSFMFKDPNTDDPAYQISYTINDNNDNALKTSVNLGDYESMTSPDIVITDGGFYVEGSKKTDKIQPRVIFFVKGYAGGSNPKHKTEFNLQTSVTQRALDS